MRPRPGGASPRLDLGLAIEEGWAAFRRAPWSFVAFALLLTLLTLACSPLQSQLSDGSQLSMRPLDWLLAALGLLVRLLISLWGTVGLVRGAGHALDGGHPSLGALMRWDGGAMRRVLLPWLALGGVLAVPLLALLLLLLLALALLWLIEAGLGGIGETGLTLLGLLLGVLALACLTATVMLLLYLGVNQQFLAQIALTEGPGGRATVERGRAVVDPHWLQALLLLLLKGLLLLLGLLAMGVGFFVAWPVVTCVTTAAYRQLFQPAAQPNGPVLSST